MGSYLDDQVDELMKYLFAGVLPDCESIPIRAFLREQIDITHENGTPEGTRDAVLSFAAQNLRLLESALEAKGYLGY